MKAHRLCMLALLLAGFHAVAPAQDFNRSPSYSLHDTDHDGYLSRTEYEALRAHCLAQRDARGRARCNPTRLLPFDTLDSDGDGRIAEDEIVGAVAGRHRHRGGWRN